MFFLRQEAIQRHSIFAHSKMREQRHIGARLGKLHNIGRRHVHGKADAVHVDEGCISASAGHCAFQECNHRQPLTSGKR